MSFKIVPPIPDPPNPQIKILIKENNNQLMKNHKSKFQKRYINNLMNKRNLMKMKKLIYLMLKVKF